MKVLFVASELTPIAKVGGLGDVMEALPKALAKLGVQTSVVIPRYGFIPKKNMKMVARGVPVPLAREREKVDLFETKIPGTRVKVFLVENADYWTHAPEPYFEQTAFAGAEKEIQRFVFFSKAVCALIKAGYLKTDILHANDWHAGALVSLINAGRKKNKTVKRFPKVVFTIHNLSNQGEWNAKEIDKWFFSGHEKKIFKNFDGEHNFIAEGILNADWVTTVSPTYAREILTDRYGNGIDNILRKKSNKVTGILNGIDYDFFNPAKDPFIAKRFTTHSVVSGKQENKAKLITSLGLTRGDVPLFGLVSRLTDQKGIDFVVKALHLFTGKHDARFIILGRGSADNEKALMAIAKEFPERVSVTIGFDEKLAHRIYAASDFFLMPSRFEPSGLGQMIAMRYGAVPIVRATGGLKDSVKHLKTGIVFHRESWKELFSVIQLAVKFYVKQPNRFLKIQKNCLKENFDFSMAAEKYLDLYKKVLRF